MQWFSLKDKSKPIITAEKHIASSHNQGYSETKLPKTCVIFEIGMALSYIENNYKTKVLIEKLPCFLESPKCIAIKGYDDICFTRGGYSAPAAVDTLETIRALGVSKVVVVGMCGVFTENIDVGDIIIPNKVLSEEGTSHHYFENHKFSYADHELFDKATTYFNSKFNVNTNATVTTDAVYRQTYYKEALWRKLNCVGVDMESSALLAVSKYYNIPAVSILLASDKHPTSQNNASWSWGNCDFNEKRQRFIDEVVSFSLNL